MPASDDIISLFRQGRSSYPRHFSNRCGAQIKQVNLSGNKLKYLDSSIFWCSNLQKLFINDNDLFDLPEDIEIFISMKHLELANNHLITLPQSIGDLKSLKILILSGNPIKSFPSSVVQLTMVKRLELENCGLEIIPKEIFELKSLDRLKLSKNQIKEIPSGIVKLTQLQQLWLQENEITWLPRRMATMSSLHYVHLANNKITSIPPEFSNLAAIMVCQGCPIIALGHMVSIEHCAINYQRANAEWAYGTSEVWLRIFLQHWSVSETECAGWITLWDTAYDNFEYEFREAEKHFNGVDPDKSLVE